MNTLEDILLNGVLVLCGLILIVLSLLTVIYIPAGAVAEAECLKKGYPKAHVTYNLERYCSTLDGAVTVKVTKQ